MIKVLSQTHILLLARKRLAETCGIEMTPDELAAFFLARGCGGLNFALSHLRLAMEDVIEWSLVTSEIRWSIWQAERANYESTDDL